MKVLRVDYRCWVVLIFLLVLAFRLVFVFQTPYFDEDSYFAVRQVDSILESGRPVFDDGLSYGGRLNVFFPTYYYLLAGFSFLLGGTLALKLIPSILLASFSVIVFFIARELTSNIKVSLLVSFFAGFIPSFFLGPLNSVSPLSLFLPLMFLCVYFFLNVQRPFFLYLYVLCIFLLGIVSPLSFLFALGLIIFLLLTKLEYKKQNRLDLELCLFSIFLLLWIQFLFYKKAFLFHGFGVVWQNIPAAILSDYFMRIEVIDVLYAIGLIPLFFGIFTVYRYILKEKNRQVYFIVAFALSVALLLWLRLIALDKGLVLLGAVLIVLSAQSFKLFLCYFEKTKLSRFRVLLWVGVILVFSLTSIVTSVDWAMAKMGASPSGSEMSSLEWMRYNTPEGSSVLATVDEGFLISGVAQRRNVADRNFLLVKDADVIFDDIDTIFTTRFETRAIELLDKYGVDYIYFSERAVSRYGIEWPFYIEGRCFPLVYNESAKIYRVRCHVKDE